jgi:hypothetical protein
MTREEALRILGLEGDSTEADVKLAYKEMAQILHPDKFANNKRLSERASEQFKRVNEAREVLLGRRAARSTASRRPASRGAGGSRAGRAAAADSGADPASTLKARLAGIAAARVQMTSQLDAEIDRRLFGMYLVVGGIIVMLVGTRMPMLEPVGGTALIWGAFQLFSSQANIKVIKQHLAGLEKDRKKYEEELENL